MGEMNLAMHSTLTRRSRTYGLRARSPKTIAAFAWLGVVALATGCEPSEHAPSPSPTNAEPEAQANRDAKPNMLVYIVDTLRADALGTYGADASTTPAADAFAQEGLVFDNAYAPSSWTRASVASILTGEYPIAHGAEDRGDRLGDDATVLPEVLSQSGYYTGLITTNPNVGSFFGFRQGFDDLVELYDAKDTAEIHSAALIASADDVADAVEQWLDKAPEPFLLVVLSIDPHSPYSPPSDYIPALKSGQHAALDGTGHWINRKDLSGADQERIRSLYAGEVRYADAGFGRVLKSLRTRGLEQRTISVLTSDHGEEFWEHGIRGHGKSLYDEALRVPLIIRAPGRIDAGIRSDRHAETIDILPTLLDLASLPKLEGIAGESLVAEPDSPLAGSSAEAPVYASLTLGKHRMLAVRDRDWKLIWDLNSGTKELFDMRAPGEQTNAAPGAPARTAALMTLLTNHRERTEQRRTDIYGAGGTADAPPATLPDIERALLIELGYIDQKSNEESDEGQNEESDDKIDAQGPR
ncbi:MAG: arylsulfatase A-like enzyme [Myxococcota bacterium]|jgi:arylsulfatase A-like enzyme